LPCFRLSHLCGCAAQRQNENVCSWEGVEARRRRASTPKPSRQGGVWGNPVSPCPNRCWERLAPPTGRGAVRQAHRRWGNPVSPYVHLRPHARSAQRRDDHGVSLGGPPPPWPSPAGGGNRAPPRREGGGETRFPHFPIAVGSGWRPHRQGCGSTGSPQVGKPGFPVCSPQAPCAERTTPR